MAEHSRRAGAGLLLIVTFALVGTGLVACGREAGRPRPAEAPPGTGAVVRSLSDLDPCALLTPADYPFEPGTSIPPKHDVQPGGACTWNAKTGDDFFDAMSTTVGILRTPFGEYRPPSRSTNGRSTSIAGRPAWIGSALPSQAHRACDAVFGAGDASISVELVDERASHPDPCQTVAELAEIVAARTPPPHE